MKVSIKKFEIPLDVKTNGIEFEVHSPDGGDHLGDLILTNTKLIWCEGRIPRENGKEIEWDEFIALMNAR